MKKALLFTLVLLTTAFMAWAAEEDVKIPESDQPLIQAEPKWSPEYGPEGDLLNGERAVVPFGTSVPGDQPEEPPRTQTIILFEDFEEPVGWLGDNPPAGWTVLDSALSSGLAWDNYDWYRYTSATWGVALARVQGGAYADDYLISPSVNFSTATTCSLTYRYYYDDFTTNPKDTAMVWLSDDGGTSWGFEVIRYAEVDSGTLAVPKIGRWDISSFAAGKNDIKVAFRYAKDTTGTAGSFGVDNVRFVADAVELLNENMDGAWGVFGDSPPAGWNIIDNNPPYNDPWNNNDWHQLFNSTWGNFARVNYTTPIEQQNEWLITPALNLAPAADQVLLRFKQFYNDDTDDYDTASVYGSTDGGATWPYEIVRYYQVDQGSSAAPNYASLDVTTWANGQTNVAFAFKYVGNNSFYWWIDSLYVETLELASDDVATNAINSPTFAATGYNWDVNIQVYNNGTSTVSFQDSTKIANMGRITFMFEDFEDPVHWLGDNPPTGWAVLDSGDALDGWNNNDWHGYTHSSAGTETARIYYSPTEIYQNETLIGPAVDLTGQTNAYFSMRCFWNWSEVQDTFYILGTTNNWTSTNVVAQYTADFGSTPSLPTLIWDISSWAAGQSNVQIALKYIGGSSLSYGYFDDCQIFTYLPPVIDYVSGETVSNLTSLEVRDVLYTSTWNDPDAGEYRVTSFTNLATDSDRSNDTLSLALNAYEHYESGGPDAGNYVWATDKDGGTGSPYNWIDITAIGTPVNFNLGSADDRWTSGIPLGFTFTFYTNPYTRIFIGENGFASFDTITASELTNYQIPSTSGQDNLLALLWDDLSGVASGSAYYYTNNADTFIVSYVDWDFYSTPASRIDMEMILCATDGSIKFQYQTMGPVITLSHTIGIEDDPGSIGLEFVYNGSPMGNIALPGLAISFRYAPPSYDAAVQGINSPGSLLVLNQPVTPKTVVTNLGGLQANVPVNFEIYDSTYTMIYSATTTINNMVPLATDTAFFTPFTPTIVGNHRCSTYTALPGDADPSNDFGTSTFFADQHYGEGGPDDYNYRWIDNTVSDPGAPVYNWIDITLDGTPIAEWDTGTVDDGRTWGIYMGFPSGFWYYGTVYDSISIGTNAWLSFLSQTSNYLTNYSPPSLLGPTAGIFPGWDDQDGGTVGTVYYKYDVPNNRFIVSWVNWPYYPDPVNPHNFQVIINGNDSSVVMQFGPVDPTVGRYQYDITVGIQNEARDIGLSYYHGSSTTVPGTPKLNLPYDGLAIKFKYAPLSHDIRTQAFLAPDLSGIVGEPISPQVDFLNFGFSSETSIPVRLTIAPGGYNNTQTIPALTPGQTATVNFANFTPSAVGTYTLTAIAELGTDLERANDTLLMEYAVYNSLFDFESGPGAFVPTGDWQWGAPSNPEAPAPTSGDNYWGTGLYGDYHAGLSTLEFNLNLGSTAPAIAFSSWYDTENRYDGGNFSISTDGGASWIVVEPTRGYDTTGNASNPLAGQRIFTGHNQKFWEVVTFPLTDYAGASVMARFAFGADASVFYPGWFIDDLGLVDCQVVSPNMVYNPSTIAGTAPEGGVDIEPINISNNGQAILRINASATIDPPALLLNSPPRLTNPRPDMKMVAEEVDEVNKTEDQPPMVLDIVCPIGSIYGQDPSLPTESWTFGTSDVDPGPNYLRYESLAGINAEISEFHFWGIDAFHNGTAWVECETDPDSFVITFYEDDAGMPGAIVGAYDLSISGIPTGQTFGTLPFIQKEYIAMLSPTVTVYGGWVSVQGSTSGDNCWLLWQNSFTGDGASWFFDGTSIVADDIDLSMCILGTDLTWLSANPIYLEVAPGANGVINAVMDATNLTAGTHTGDIYLATNAPQGTVNIPVTFVVTGVGGCSYIPGDINNFGGANGIDVTYGVAYLKGGNPPPIDCNPPCTDVPYDPFYAAMDVNATCSTNGIDITYFVAYLKGLQPTLRYCEDCPPARLAAPSIEAPLIKAIDIKPAGGAR